MYESGAPDDDDEDDEEDDIGEGVVKVVFIDVTHVYRRSSISMMEPYRQLIVTFNT